MAKSFSDASNIYKAARSTEFNERNMKKKQNISVVNFNSKTSRHAERIFNSSGKNNLRSWIHEFMSERSHLGEALAHGT